MGNVNRFIKRSKSFRWEWGNDFSFASQCVSLGLSVSAREYIGATFTYLPTRVRSVFQVEVITWMSGISQWNFGSFKGDPIMGSGIGNCIVNKLVRNQHLQRATYCSFNQTWRLEHGDCKRTLFRLLDSAGIVWIVRALIHYHFSVRWPSIAVLQLLRAIVPLACIMTRRSF